MPIKHPFTSGKADGADATEVQPSNWNDDHVGDNTLDRDLTQIEIVNSTTETSIYSKSISAGILGSDGGVRLTIGGTFLNNSGATRNLLFRIKLGATTVLATNSFPVVVDADERQWKLDIYFLNSAAAAQKWGASFILGVGTGGTGFTITDPTSFNMYIGAGYATSAEDTTGALVLDVTAQHSFAHASLNIKKEVAVLELIPAS